MHKRVVVSLDHRMGRVAKPETLKAPPLKEVWALARSPNTNKSTEICMTLGEYPRFIPSTNFARPHDELRCERSLMILPIIQWASQLLV